MAFTGEALVTASRNSSHHKPPFHTVSRVGGRVEKSLAPGQAGLCVSIWATPRQ